MRLRVGNVSVSLGWLLEKAAAGARKVEERIDAGEKPGEVARALLVEPLRHVNVPRVLRAVASELEEKCHKCKGTGRAQNVAGYPNGHCAACDGTGRAVP